MSRKGKDHECSKKNKNKEKQIELIIEKTHCSSEHAKYKKQTFTYISDHKQIKKTLSLLEKLQSNLEFKRP